MRGVGECVYKMMRDDVIGLLGLGLSAVLAFDTGGMSAMAAEAGARPIVITVDDLPIAASRLHETAADRRRVWRFPL